MEFLEGQVRVGIAELIYELYNKRKKGSNFADASNSTLHSFPVWRRSPASRKRQRKGNPVPGVISGPPCSWWI
jgi:hypothetical protein